jgi:nickel/cobalt exporter
MESIFIGFLGMSMLHALIPNHWLPLISVGTVEKWKHGLIYRIGLFSILAHLTGTILLGIFLALAGHNLSKEWEPFAEFVAPILLITIGLIYLLLPAHHHHFENKKLNALRSNPKNWMWVFMLSMFLSPCLQIEGLFLAAGAYGLWFLALCTVAYVVFSCLGVMFILWTSLNGSQFIKTTKIEKYQTKIIGLLLILIGAVTIIF